jgi:DNA-binding CsgD family transcriptional regulator
MNEHENGDPQYPEPPTGHRIFSPQQWRRIGASLGLSNRDAVIVQEIFDDRPARAIAGELDISPNTVVTYIRRLYQKLGVHSRVELIVCVCGEYLANQPNHPS